MPWAHRYVAESSGSATKTAKIPLLATKRWRAHKPDNPKVGDTRADRYEPELQRSYEELAAHYQAVIIPARPARPSARQRARAWVLPLTIA